MPSTIVCPNCRKTQEESGRLTCPECSAILPSIASSAPAPSRPAAASASALDDFAIPVRPTGAMTLLRNDLRSEDKNRQQTSWLENIIPRKTKEPGEPDSAMSTKAKAEPPTPSAIPAYPTGDSALEPKKVKAPVAPVPAPAAAAVRVPAPTPARAERAEPAPVAFQPTSRVADAGPSQSIPVIGLVSAVGFVLISAVSLLKGKEGWLGAVVLLTAGMLGAAILGTWHRTGRQKAFWQGFAVFGIGYLLMAFVPAFPNEAGIELPTSKLIRVGHSKLTGTPEDPRSSFEIMKALPTKPEVPDQSGSKELFDPEKPEAKTVEAASNALMASGDLRQFTVVGHCLFTLVFAFIGSALAGWFYRSSPLA